MPTIYQKMFQLLGNQYNSTSNSKSHFKIDPNSDHEIEINSGHTNRIGDDLRVFITMPSPGLYAIDDDGDSLNEFDLDPTVDKTLALNYLKDQHINVLKGDCITLNYAIQPNNSNSAIAMALVNRIHHLIQVQIKLDEILKTHSKEL